MNRQLAMKHAYIMQAGTAINVHLNHICEMPLFVPSELCNGVQLTDLCSYNIYRVFMDEKLDYPFFRRIVPHIWSLGNRIRSDRCRPFTGLYVFPAESPLKALADEFEKKRTLAASGQGSQKVTYGGANPINNQRHRTRIAIGRGIMTQFKECQGFSQLHHYLSHVIAPIAILGPNMDKVGGGFGKIALQANSISVARENERPLS